MNWLEIAKEFGPYCGLVFFFLWRDSQREERRDAEIKQLHEFIQKTLIGLVEKSNEALNGPKQP